MAKTLALLLALCWAVPVWADPDTFSGYTTVQEEGTALTKRRKLNFIGTGVTCADNSANTRTNCTISGGSFDATAVDDITWSDGTNAANTWTFDVSGTDTTIVFGNGVITIGANLTLTTGKHLTLGTTQWDNGSDKIDGEQVADDTIDDDSIDFADIEDDLEALLDIGGEVTSTGMASTVIADSVTVNGWVLGTSSATALTVGSLLGVDSIDATGAVDMDYGSADITDHTLIADGGTAIIDGSFQFPDADGSPAVAGELQYDNTVAGLLDGALAWYDDDAVRYLVDLDTLPVDDDFVVAYDATADGFYMKADADSGGATAWSAIGDAAGDGAVAMAETVQTLDWNTDAVASLAITGLSLTYTNDAAADVLSQTLFRVANLAGANGIEVLQEIGNDDADDVATTGLLFTSGAGAMTTAIDATDAEIGTALSVAANDIVGTTGLINFNEFDVEADGDIVATDITLEGGDLLTGNIALRLGDATTDSVTIVADGTADADFVAPNTSIGAAEIVTDTLTTTQMAATLTFADADLLDFGTNISATNEGILLPAHATSCASATSEGQVCWEEDADNLWVGDGAAAKQMNGGGADTNAEKEYWIPCLALYPIVADDSVPPLSKDAGTNIDQLNCTFDASTDEARTGTFKAPSDINTSGNATVRFYWYSSVNADGSTDEVVWDFKYTAGTADGVDPDSTLSTQSVTATTATTAGQLDVSAPTAFSISTAAWVANDLVYFVINRDANNAADDLEVDAILIGVSIEIPRA